MYTPEMQPYIQKHSGVSSFVNVSGGKHSSSNSVSSLRTCTRSDLLSFSGNTEKPSPYRKISTTPAPFCVRRSECTNEFPFQAAYVDCGCVCKRLRDSKRLFPFWFGMQRHRTTITFCYCRHQFLSKALMVVLLPYLSPRSTFLT